MNMEELYHYTKYDVLDKIVKKDNIDLRATYYQRFGVDDYECFRNDSVNIIKKICEENNWNYDPDMLTIKPFITSFCTNSKSAYMWGHYADEYKGIKLIFDKETLLNVKHNYGVDEKGEKHYINKLECTSPCTYIDDNDVKAYLLQCYKKSSIDKEMWSPFERLTLLLTTLKKAEPFKAEDEYRHICLYPVIFTMSYSEEKQTPIIDDDPAPEFEYLHLYYPQKLLLGIELGCKTTEENMSNAISCLENNGYKISNIENKTILLK